MKLSHDDYDWMYGASDAKDQGNFFLWLWKALTKKRCK